eukprot:1142304-Pelagomonas_calceolata.AAC.4
MSLGQQRNANQRHVHFIEIKYCENTRSGQQGLHGLQLEGVGLQPETLADPLLVKHSPASKIETNSDNDFENLYESLFRKALISRSVKMWKLVKKGIKSASGSWAKEPDHQRVIKLAHELHARPVRDPWSRCKCSSICRGGNSWLSRANVPPFLT